jgi:biotin synthase
VPVNLLVPWPARPWNIRKVAPLDLVRVVATARMLMPRARVRLSAGRKDLSDAEHALCFLAGTDSIFAGDRLLTTANVDGDRDRALLARLGLVVEPAPASACAPATPTMSAAPARPAPARAS